MRIVPTSLGVRLLLAVIACPGAVQARKPNVVFLMADELGYYELSCMGNPNIATPNIDKLAVEGVRFTQALAGSTVCAPTRAVLMTGKHSGHTSVRSNGGGTPLRAEEETIASVLKTVGYATGGFGKWGCGGRGSTGVPENHGFDVFLGYYDQVHAHSYYPPYLIRNSEEVPLPGNHGLSDGDTYSHYVIYDHAVEFIKANRDRPFFCYLPFTPPHGIFDIPDDDPAWADYKDKPWPEPARRYAAMVGMLDRQVGELIALLKKLDLDDDTIFFFCGDNGGADYFRSKAFPRGIHGANKDPRTGVEFRGSKGSLYEGGLRIPMIVRWPGHIQPGRVSDFLWYFPDVLPTLAELAVADPPDDIDGLSIVPELIGEEAAGRKQPEHPYLYWEIGRQTAVRMGHWKSIKPGRNADWELYDLAGDISETHDLAADHPETLARMQTYAGEAHEDVREGVFFNRAIHEKDRQAKFGDHQQPKPAGPVQHLPQDGLIPPTKIKIVRASSESQSNDRLAAYAVDGNPSTFWHTEWMGGIAQQPHELVLDLGADYTIRAFRYLARQDNGVNGTIKTCEFFISDSPDTFEKPAARATFTDTKSPQETTCEPTRGRYILLHTLSEINGGPWATVAELGVVGD